MSVFEVLSALLLFLGGLPFASPATFDDSYRAGLLALQKNQLSVAKSNLETAAKIAPKNGRVWVALSQTYWKLQESTKAEDAAVKASSLASSDPVVLQSLVIYYSESSQMLKAAEAQARYADVNPG